MNRQLIDTRFQRDPELRFTHPGPQQLLQLWQQKRGSKTVPNRADLDAFALRDYLPRIIIYDFTGTPPQRRFRFRLYGTLVSTYSGRDPTGRFLDEVMSSGTVQDYDGILSWVCEQHQPLRTVGKLHYLDRSFVAFEAVNLPLCSAGSDVDQVLSAVYYDADLT